MSAAALSLSAFLALAAECAPGVAPETLASVVQTESGFQTFAVGVNPAGSGSYSPRSREAAEALVASLLARGHRSLDLGVAQINTAAGHLQRRGLPLSAAFEPCTALRVGGGVLAECYRRAPPADEQARLRAALGCYNTGRLDPAAPYVRRVQAAAEVIVPAIRAAGPAAARRRVAVAVAEAPSRRAEQAPSPSDAASWDTWASPPPAPEPPPDTDDGEDDAPPSDEAPSVAAEKD